MPSQSFSTAGAHTFNVPAGVTSITVECWGAGGGGGDNYPGTTGGGGGGGGGYSRSVLVVVPLDSHSVSVGDRGDSGVAGGDTTFGTGPLVRAKGGQSSSDDSTGIGGSAASGIGDVTFSGGDGPANGGGSGGAGGGSSAGTAANGANGTAESGATGGAGGTAPAGGGNGGAGGNNGATGTNGSTPGGGGGGGGNTDGGLGGLGLCTVTWATPEPPPPSELVSVECFAPSIDFQSMGESVGYLCKSLLSRLSGLLYPAAVHRQE